LQTSGNPDGISLDIDLLLHEKSEVLFVHINPGIIGHQLLLFEIFPRQNLFP
jgi:hypothetical protein